MRWMPFIITIFGASFILSCSGCSNGKTTIDEDSALKVDTDNLSDSDMNDERMESDDVKNDEDYSDVELPDSDYDIIQDNFTLENECFGKKVLTKEIVEVDKNGDGFTGDGDDYFYYIDRYYDKKCLVKFEVKYKTEDIAGIWDGSRSPSYEYDDKGNVKKACFRDRDGKLEACYGYAYEFNSEGKVIKMCNGNKTEGRDVGCVYYFYDESGKLKQRIRNTSDSMGYLLFYRDYSEIGSEFFADDYSTYNGEYDRQERIDYFYDEKGRLKNKDRYFLYEEYDVNDYVISRRGYNVVNRMYGKFKIDYDYNSVKLPVKSSHYEVYKEDYKAFYTAEYERNYSYDDKMRPTKITTNCVSCGAGWKAWLDEWEYYPDGTLKRHRESLDKGGGYEERTYDEKGREITYKEVEYTGNIWKTEEKTYYEDTDNIKTNKLCYEEKCNLWDYTYEFDEHEKKISEIRLYDYDESPDGLIYRYGDEIFFKYDIKNKIIEKKIYTVWYPKGNSEDFTKTQKEIYIYSYDEKERLIEVSSSNEWNEPDPFSSDKIWITEKYSYDSLNRITDKYEKGRYYNLSYHGNTTAKNRVWLKNGTITYEYDEKGNLVSEVYENSTIQQGDDDYIYKFVYDKNNCRTSGERSRNGRKENHKYFYTTFEGEPK